MAYQPKSYRKFVATAATATLVASAFAPFASAATDVPADSRYASAVDFLATKGVTGFADGTFKPSQNITRTDAAVMLVNVLGLDIEAAPESGFTDVPARATKHVNALKAAGITNGAGGGKFDAHSQITRGELAIWIYKAFDLQGSSYVNFTDVSERYYEAVAALVANGITNGKTATTFGTNQSATRGDYAIFLQRAFGASDVGVVAGIKAINATTVEVTYKDTVTVEDIAAAKYTIDGLTVSNAAIKQTDSKTVVLTTSAQEGGKTYTVKNNGSTVGTFKGVSAVIPTAINVTTPSIQGIVGKEVTLSAQVTVPEGQAKAGIPVTFNIVSDKSTNEKVEVVAYTNEEGVASYSYTRYYSATDDVTAYATSKSSVNSKAKVYWANAAQLTIEEVTKSNELANNAKKVYKVKSANKENDVVFVAFEENIGAKANTVVDVEITNAVGYIDEDGRYKALDSEEVTPWELTNGDAQYVVIELDKDGEGTFTLTGSEDSATPIVYEADHDLDLKDLNKDHVADKGDGAYSKTALQAKAPTVKFAQDDVLEIDVKAAGTEDAAETKRFFAEGTTINSSNDINLGGREYTVTVKDEKGNLASKGTKAYVTFGDDFEGRVQVIIDDKIQEVTEDEVYLLTVENNKGEVSFRVIGEGNKSYATPTVFLNTTGSTSPVKLDDKDVQEEAETTYFTDVDVEEAKLTVLDKEGNSVTSLRAQEDVTVVYQSVDQNGFAYASDRAPYNVTFELSTTFGELKVDGEDVQKQGSYYTYKTRTDSNGKAEVVFTAEQATDVTISVSGANSILPVKDATVKFTYVNALPAKFTGLVTNYNLAKDEIKLGSYDTVSYANSSFENEKGAAISKEAFEAYLTNYDDVLVTAIEGADGVYDFTVVSFELKEVVDKTALIEAIEEAEEALENADQYTEASVTALEEAIEEAEEVAEDKNATTAEVTAATKAVKDAIKALVSIEQGEVYFTSSTVADATPILPSILDLYEISGAVAGEDSDKVAKVQIVFVEGANPVEATYNAATGEFNFEGSQVPVETITIYALDSVGNELAKKAITVE